MLLRSLLVLLACLSLAFAVTPAQAQQVQLTWDAPLQTNGTSVTNLAGYRLYYGSQSHQYQAMIPVGLTTTYTVTNVSAGQTYYFAVKAYSTTGAESAFSNEASVTLPVSSKPSITLSAAPATIVPGQAATLTWSATNATSCAAPWTTSKATAGSQSGKPTATTTYTMSCTGTSGTSTASTTVSVSTSVIPSATAPIRVVSVDSQQLAATKAIDGNPATFWHTAWNPDKPLPHTLVLDLGGQYQVDGLRYLPRQDGSSTAPLPATNSTSAPMAPPGAAL